MKRYLPILAVILVAGVLGAWYWAGRTYQLNMASLLEYASNNPYAKTTYDSEKISPFTFTTEFRNLKIVVPLPMGSDFARDSDQKLGGKSRFFKDMSDQSTFEIQVTGKSFVSYNPLTNKLKINSSSKVIYTLSNPSRKVRFYVPEEAHQELFLGLGNRQIVFSPIVLGQHLAFGSLLDFLSRFKSAEIDTKNYKLIEESSGKAFFTQDKSFGDIKIISHGDTRDVSIEGSEQNSQFHKIEGNPFVDDLVLLAPQLFSDNPGKMEVKLSAELPKGIMEFVKVPDRTPLPPFRVDLKKYQSSDKYFDTDGTLIIVYDKKFFTVKGQSTSVVHVERSILVDKISKLIEAYKPQLQGKPEQNRNQIKSYVDSLMPDLKALSPIKLTVDLKVPVVTPSTLQTLGEGHVNLEFDTNQYGMDISGEATPEGIHGQISLKNSVLFLNHLGNFVSRVMAIVNPTKKPQVDRDISLLKPKILSCFTPDSTEKNHAIRIVYDKKTGDFKVGSQNLKEMREVVAPLLAIGADLQTGIPNS